MTRSKMPPRWSLKHGAYYFQVPPDLRPMWDGKTWFRLGATIGEAWRTWYERTSPTPDATTLNGLIDDWWTGYVLPYLKPSTQAGYIEHVKPLRKVFGHMKPGALRLDMAYRYRDKRPRVAGNRELSVLSSILDYGLTKGVIAVNPLKGNLSRRGASAEPVRRRVPSLGEIEAFCKSAPTLAPYVALKLLTGLRQGQLLAINLTDHWDRVTLSPPASKGGRDTQYSGEALSAAIAEILNGRLERGPLFLNRNRKPMTATGFKSAWRRAMANFDGEPFHEHDIRKTVASGAESLENAQQLLGHQDSRTTAKVYRIGPVKLKV